MKDSSSSSLPGEPTLYPATLNRTLLRPIAREDFRRTLAARSRSCLESASGFDLWRCYELSWMTALGIPEVRVLDIKISSSSNSFPESKSLKLYLMSLHSSVFESEAALNAEICTAFQQKLSLTPGGDFEIFLHKLDEPCLAPTTNYSNEVLENMLEHSKLEGYQLDGESQAHLLEKAEGSPEITRHYRTNLFRSLCPLTSQPDWASVDLVLKGAKLKPAAFLSYVLSYRNLGEFHESCCEKIFSELSQQLVSQQLESAELCLSLKFTRRGGIEINPYRATSSELLNSNLHQRTMRQ